MHTSSYWLTIPAAVMASLPFGGDDRRDGVVGLAFAMRNVAQLLLMCDGHDIGLSVDGGIARALDADRRDRRRAGGARDASRTSSSTTTIPAASASAGRCSTCTRCCSARTRELIAGCPCESGCPSCVGPEGNTGPHAKLVASEILDQLLRGADGRLMDLSCAAARDSSGAGQPRRRSQRLRPPSDGVRASSPTSRTPARYEATIDLDRVADVLGGRIVDERASAARLVDRSPLRVGPLPRHASGSATATCDDGDALRLLDPGAARRRDGGRPRHARTLFVDLETTGLSGGAGTVAFLVGCGWFDLGAFQVRQFLLTSYAASARCSPRSPSASTAPTCSSPTTARRSTCR